MSANNEYKRYFIILQEDDKGYEISPGKIPTGYVKIEVKNGRVKLNAFVQNVKIEGVDEYRLILIAPGKNTAVDVGKIIVDSSGRGELYYELESDNVLKSGMNISEFSIAAVLCGVSIPVSGYSGREKVEWKGKYEIVNRSKAAEEPRIDKKIQIEEIVPQKQEPIIPIVEEVQPPPPPIITQPVKEPEPENVQVPPKGELPEEESPAVKCPPIAPMEEPAEVECPPAAPKKEPDEYQYYYYEDDEYNKEEYHEHKHYEGKPYESCKEYPYYDSTMYAKLKKLLRRLRRYEPFEDERDFEWFKVGDDIYEINSVAIPYMGYMVPMGYPFMLEGYGMMNKKDFILGVKYGEADDEDKKMINYVMFGIPSVYSRKYEVYYKSRGFMSFKPHKSKPYGYFIMCVDLRSGMFCHLS